MINTIPVVDIASPIGDTVEDLKFWLEQFDRQFRVFVADVNTDLNQGTSTLEVYPTMPGIKEIDEGQRFLFWTGTELRQYTNFNDEFYYTILTKEV